VVSIDLGELVIFGGQFFGDRLPRGSTSDRSPNPAAASSLTQQKIDATRNKQCCNNSCRLHPRRALPGRLNHWRLAGRTRQARWHIEPFSQQHVQGDFIEVVLHNRTIPHNLTTDKVDAMKINEKWDGIWNPD
jgi:hypothetical protein